MLQLTEYHRYAILNAPRDAALEILILARRINYLTFMHADDELDREDARKTLADVDSLDKVMNLLSSLETIQ